MKKEIYHKLTDIAGSSVWLDEPMKKHTTFRIGGPADYYVMPHTAEEIKKVLRVCKEEEIPYYILGHGSNLLVSDGGYRGVVIQIFNNMGNMEVCGNKMKVQAGVLLSKAANTALEHSLSGFAFASGIPGTMGGAVVMNAGAYGGEIKDVLKRVKVLTKEGEILQLHRDELELGYRTSVIPKKEYIVLEAELVLEPGDAAVIKSRMDELKEQRFEKQPLQYPSAGSTFKRPENNFAGKLIMEAGLAGYAIGDAQVSEKHCGFFINKGEATASEMYRLICEVTERVEEQFSVRLEPEVKMLGDFS